jgi:hypothetical protein
MARERLGSINQRQLYTSISLVWLAVLISTVSFAQSTTWPFATPPPKGDGSTDDTKAIQDALTAAATECGTVELACTASNTYVVSSSLQVPKCVRFVGACGAVPFEGSETTIGTTLKLEQKRGIQPDIVTNLPKVVVSFHNAPGATISGISIDCNNLPRTVGILYDSDNQPTASFLNVDNLMIKGCHQAFVVGLPTNTATPPASCQTNEQQGGCTQADSFKFERYRILGNLNDSTGEGIHINSSNGAQSSLIFNGNIQGVNIGVHVISTNQGLIVENTDTGSPLGTAPAFLQIECSVADSPTLINDEVEGNTSAVIDHGINPARQCNASDQASTCGGACEPACSKCKLGTPGNPVWLNNTWNNHAIVVDGTEHITSIGNLLNQGTIESAQASVMSINETGWSVGGTATVSNLGSIGGITGATGGAVFGASLKDEDVIMAENNSCPGFPQGREAGDLVSCEGLHAGRLFLGGDLMLLNNGDGTLDTEGRMRIQTGLYNDGSGVKHQSVETGSIAPGTIAKVPLTWATPFADANYQAVCAVADNSEFLQLVNTSVPTQSQVVAAIRNNDGSASHTGSLACFAIHD